MTRYDARRLLENRRQLVAKKQKILDNIKIETNSKKLHKLQTRITSINILLSKSESDRQMATELLVGTLF